MAKYGNENAAAGGRSRDTASRDRNYGGGSGGGLGGGRSGGRVGPQGRANPAQADGTAGPGTPGGAADRGRAPGPVGNDTTATRKRAGDLGVTPDRYIDAARSYRGRITDYDDTDNDFIDDVGNFIAGGLGVHEEEPDFDINNMNPNADWGFDVVGALAGAAGAAMGVPLAGTLVSGVEDLLGVRDDLSVPLGPGTEEGMLGDDEGDVLGQGSLVDEPTGDTGAPGGEPGAEPGGSAGMGDEDEGTPATDAMEGGGGAPGIDAGVDDIFPSNVAVQPPVKKPPKKPVRPYSTVGLQDVASFLDQLGT